MENKIDILRLPFEYGGITHSDSYIETLREIMFVEKQEFVDIWDVEIRSMKWRGEQDIFIEIF